jgi:hypothetical protein
MPDALPSPHVLAEQAYLVARGVRRLSLAGHCHLPDDADVALLTLATELEPTQSRAPFRLSWITVTALRALGTRTQDRP